MLYQYSRCLGNWYSDIGGTTGGPNTDAVHHPTLIFPLLLTHNIHQPWFYSDFLISFCNVFLLIYKVTFQSVTGNEQMNHWNTDSAIKMLSHIKRSPITKQKASAKRKGLLPMLIKSPRTVQSAKQGSVPRAVWGNLRSGPISPHTADQHNPSVPEKQRQPLGQRRRTL